MVDDCEIKTKVSPFAMRTQEIKVFDGKDGYVSMNQSLPFPTLTFEIFALM